MKGWPSRRRLLWGRRSLMRGLAWPTALLLVITLAVGLYFVLPLFSLSQNNGHDGTVDVAKAFQVHGGDDRGSTNLTDSNLKTLDETGSYRDILKIAASQMALSATINTTSRDGQATTYAEIKNSGQDLLRRIKIATNDGKVVGFLPELWPGERKTVALSGDLGKVNITATDSSGREVISSVQYKTPRLPATVSGLGPVLGDGSSYSTESNPEHVDYPGSAAGENRLQTKAAANPANVTPALSMSKNRSDNSTQNLQTEPRFNLTIRTNRSEGHLGDIVSFSCMAVNSGTMDLSNLELVCRGNKTSTTYLTPGKEIHIVGYFVLRDNVKLNATVKGTDLKGNICKANASAEVWLISPELKLNASVVPEKVHRGDKISLSVDVENIGNSTLANLSLFDSFGRVGQISLLSPGKSMNLRRNGTANESIIDWVKAKAYSTSGQEVYGSTKVEIKVLSSGLNLTAKPQEVAVYPGQPVEVTWILNNTGEELLKNVTLNGAGSRYKLTEIAAHTSMRMSTIYISNKTARINVTAKGYDLAGYSVQDRGSLLIKAISPGISLKVTPSDISAFAGKDFGITCLVTNTGNDGLKNVILRQNGDILDRIEMLPAGEFQVFSPKLIIASNATLDFSVEGVDSLGRSWSDTSRAKVTLVASAIKISAIGPNSVKLGDSARITCTLDNPGSVPIFNILVVSKAFGPLGVVEYLAPRQQRILAVDEPVNMEINDEITAKGVTSAKLPVIDSCTLHIAAIRRPSSSINTDQIKPLQPKSLILNQKEAISSQKRSIKASYIADKSNFMPDAKNQSSSGKNASSLSATAGKINSSSLQAAPFQMGLVQKSGSEKGIATGKNVSEVSNKNAVIDEISVLIHYIKKMLEQMGHQTQAASQQEPLSSSESKPDRKASKNYELAIESVKGSDHGRMKVLDVGASPPHPSAGAPVKVTVHVESETGIESATVKFGVKDTPITKMEMPTVDRIYAIPMTLDSGDIKNGYWSCTIPGRAAGTYMVLSVALTDGVSLVDDGPYLLHWSTVAKQETSVTTSASGQASSEEGMLFIESSVVRGTGEVSIKDAFEDSAMIYNERMKGNGSISLESLRCLDKNRPMVNFTQQRDLVFEGGILQGVKSMESPAFYGGMGASVTERFNLSHVDKSETDMIRSLNSSDNTLAFNAEQAFNGTWNIKTQYAQLFKKIKGDQKYSGSFETEKKIKFQDLGKK